MSLVNYIATEDFLLFCGDQRAMNDEGKIASENIIKVRKTTNNVLFGFTGKTYYNYALCYQYVREDLSFTALTIKHDYNQICKQLKNNLKSINNFGKITDELACCVGGWNGERLCITIFHIDKELGTIVDEIYSTGIHDIRYGTLSFHQLHLNNFKNELSKVKQYSILNFKNAYKTTVELGAKFDKTINTNCSFEILKKKTFDDYKCVKL